MVKITLFVSRPYELNAVSRNYQYFQCLSCHSTCAQFWCWIFF